MSVLVYACRLPADAKKVLHPIITCAITADLAAYALGLATSKGFEAALGGSSFFHALTSGIIVNQSCECKDLIQYDADLVLWIL